MIETSICRFCGKERSNDEIKMARERGIGRIHLKCAVVYKRKIASDLYYRNQRQYIDRATKWKRDNPERDKENQRRSRGKVRLEVIRHYSPEVKCKKCGFGDIRVLTIDHIDGRTKKERENKVSGWKLYTKIRQSNYPDGYQVLCMNCQFIKRVERGEENGWHYKDES